MKNWKTDLAGAAAIMTALGHMLYALSNGDTSTIYHDYLGIVAGIGLLFSKDA